MRRRFLLITVVLALAGAALAGPAAPNEPGKPTVPPSRSARRLTPPQGQGAKVYEGRIKDVRPLWGLLVLTVGKGKTGRDLRFDMSEARIVGPSGAEWKGQDLFVGDRVRVDLTADGRLVQQISVLVAK